MNIIGLQFGHDSGIAVLKHGELVTNMIRERHNRAKHSFGINVAHIEQTLAQVSLTIEEIDVVAITSTQNYELVVADRPDELTIEYCPHPNAFINSSLYEALLRDGQNVQDLLIGRILDVTYSGCSEYHRNLFPEHQTVSQDNLGATGFLSDYINTPLWRKELGLGEIAKLDIKTIVSNDEARLGLHYPLTITLKGRSIPGISVQHHAAHAASAFYMSTTNQAAVLTHDGGFYKVGPNNGMIFYGDQNRLWPITPHHLLIGDLYDTVGSNLGFDIMSAPGKLMGLAPYGKPRFFHRLMVGNAHDLKRNGITNPKLNWLNHCQAMGKAFGYDLSPIGDVTRILEPICVDIAASTQKLFEETLLSAVEATSEIFVRAKLPMDTLCYSGGTALNCPANSRILSESAFKQVYIPPHCDDSGLSSGAALYLYHNVLDKPKHRKTPTPLKEFPYLGFKYGNDLVRAALQESKEHIISEVPSDPAQQAAQDLYEDKIIAWYEGRSELGPRALGHRSLLANPTYFANWERMNQLKSREKWRPFAPAVLEEDANLYFRGYPQSSPHMLYTATLKTTKLPAITHVDGSSRIQTVTEETGGLYHILKHLKALNGFGVVINTSFNGPGEAIVEKPEEALEFLISTKLDVLYLDGHRIVRQN